MKSIDNIDLRLTRPKTKKPQIDKIEVRSESVHHEILSSASLSHIKSTSIDQNHHKRSLSAECSESDISLTSSYKKQNNMLSSHTHPINIKSTSKKLSDSTIKSSASFMTKNTTNTSSDIPQMSEESLKRLHAMIINFIMKDDKHRHQTLATNIDLYQYSLDSGQVVNNLLLQELSIIQPNINTLNLSKCREITDVGLWAIAKHCNPGAMTELNLSGCHQITNIGIRSLALKCYAIHTFIFNDCVMMDDMLLTVIASGSWKLQRLYLRNCQSITDNGISRIARVGSSLEILDLYGCIGIGEFGETAMKEIGLYCGNLVKLDLSHCKRIEDYGLRAIAIGCTKLEELILHDCDRITGISIQAICKHLKFLRILGLIQCHKLVDKDFESFIHAPMRTCLTDLNISSCRHITDHTIHMIASAFTNNLLVLNFSYCKNITDTSSYHISSYCQKIQSLDISNCPKLTDKTISNLSGKTTCIMILKLNNNSQITMKALFQSLSFFEFAMISQGHFGYEARPNADELIKARELINYQRPYAVIIQSAYRRQIAYREYYKMRRLYLLKNYIPKFQAYVRGYLQRKRYYHILYKMHKIRCIITIQTCYRRYLQKRRRLCITQQLMHNDKEEVSVMIIQRIYRGLKGRQLVQSKRYERANELILAAKLAIKREKNALTIQTNYRRYSACLRVLILIEAKKRILQRKENELNACLFIQRIIRGVFGRYKAYMRKQEILDHLYMIDMAQNIQRVYRGHVGRKLAAHQRNIKMIRLRIRAAILIQKIFRGFIGRLQGSLAYAIRVLKFAQINAAILIQRIIRGKLGRRQVSIYKEDCQRLLIETRAVVKIQKLFRGHKGREGLIIEQELKKFDNMIQPLLKKLQQMESNQSKLKELVDHMMVDLKHEHEDLNKVEMELEYVMRTEQKYCDSSRLTSYPQRYLTKYLRVRLTEHFEHKKEQFYVKEDSIEKKVVELRQLESSIRAAKRELVPLTTGKIISIKQERAMQLRMKVRKLSAAALKIQRLWRKAIIRTAYLDPARDYWIECTDEEQSDQPFFFNTYTQETSWNTPLAYKYFCDPKLGMKFQQVVKDVVDDKESNKVLISNHNNSKLKLQQQQQQNGDGDISIASDLSDDDLSPKKSYNKHVRYNI